MGPRTIIVLLAALSSHGVRGGCVDDCEGGRGVLGVVSSGGGLSVPKEVMKVEATGQHGGLVGVGELL